MRGKRPVDTGIPCSVQYVGTRNAVADFLRFDCPMDILKRTEPGLESRKEFLFSSQARCRAWCDLRGRRACVGSVEGEVKA
jgi:hypothetical protein